MRVCGTVYGWGRPMADSADLSVDELRRLLRSTSFESCNATGSLAVDREELRRVLSTQLGRELTASELVRLWDSLDVELSMGMGRWTCTSGGRPAGPWKPTAWPAW